MQPQPLGTRELEADLGRVLLDWAGFGRSPPGKISSMMNFENRTIRMVSFRPLSRNSSSSGLMMVCTIITPSAGSTA